MYKVFFFIQTMLVSRLDESQRIKFKSAAEIQVSQKKVQISQRSLSQHDMFKSPVYVDLPCVRKVCAEQ